LGKEADPVEQLPHVACSDNPCSVETTSLVKHSTTYEHERYLDEQVQELKV
jgi:hypothetical protein